MADGKIIKINPVTRIEGHAKITIRLNAAGDVDEARFHVNEFRGFEKFCEGRYFTEMPNITPRICGICPHSHALASAKACEKIMKVQVTPTAVTLRRLIQMGQFISSHALSFFHLSAPDFLLGYDSDPATRNVLGLAAKDPELAKRGIRLRKFGQEISERITGKKIHVMGIAAGGMGYSLSRENRDALLSWYPEVRETAQTALDILKKYIDAHSKEVSEFAPAETMFMGSVGPEGQFEMYGHKIRLVDADGKIVADGLSEDDYLDFIVEKPLDWSYLKYPYYKPMGFPKGIYQVGTLARLNVVSRMNRPLAQKEFTAFKSLGRGRAIHGAFYHHYARLIELMECVEEVQAILQDDSCMATDILVTAGRNQAQGVGCTEAPRGILFHHYQVDEGGMLTKVNLLIATGQNNPSMNRAITDVAKKYVQGSNVKEGALNRVESAIRCYDPCLSCSTHALGSMPMVLEVTDAEGRVLETVART